jgi:predicted murein hydrolase (TIGR00659 family)
MELLSRFLSGSAVFGIAISILGYQIGLFAKKKLKIAIANPLLIAIIFVIFGLWLFRVDYATYKTGTQPLSYLLTPATVCLAIPLYAQFEMIRKRWKAIAAGIAAGVLANLLCVFLFSLAFHLTHIQYVTLLPKSVTSAIGIAISGEIGGIGSMTVAAIILTGIFGNIASEHILNLVRVTDPAARGLAIGVGAHAIGTARALELGETEGAMSSLAIVLTGFLTVALSPPFSILI